VATAILPVILTFALSLEADKIKGAVPEAEIFSIPP
jgi:hypothetical protein